MNIMGTGISKHADEPKAEKPSADIVNTSAQEGKTAEKLKPSGKPPWVDKYGNVSQIISAISAILFGILTATISMQLAGIQRTNLITAELGRDREIINRFYMTRRENDSTWKSSIACAKILMAANKVTPEYPNTHLNFDAEKCGESDLEKISQKSDYSFELMDRALIAWRVDMVPIRKEAYYQEFSALCEKPIVELAWSEIYKSVRYRNIVLFMKNCEYMIKEFDRDFR